MLLNMLIHITFLTCPAGAPRASLQHSAWQPSKHTLCQPMTSVPWSVAAAHHGHRPTSCRTSFRSSVTNSCSKSISCLQMFSGRSVCRPHHQLVMLLPCYMCPVLHLRCIQSHCLQSCVGSWPCEHWAAVIDLWQM